jgi:hypothetical protein
MLRLQVLINLLTFFSAAQSVLIFQSTPLIGFPFQSVSKSPAYHSVPAALSLHDVIGISPNDFLKPSTPKRAYFLKPPF